jgi:hypothetical protein
MLGKRIEAPQLKTKDVIKVIPGQAHHTLHGVVKDENGALME